MKLKKLISITLTFLMIFSITGFDAYAINYNNKISIRHTVNSKFYNEYMLNSQGKKEKIITQEIDKEHFIVKVINESGITTRNYKI